MSGLSPNPSENNGLGESRMFTLDGGKKKIVVMPFGPNEAPIFYTTTRKDLETE